MTDNKALAALLEKALAASPGTETELTALRDSTSLTRFANSVIHQNVHGEDLTVTARVAVGKRIGVVSTNRTDEGSVAALVRRAAEIAKESPEMHDFPGFPKAAAARPVAAVSKATADASPELRAQGVAKAAKIASAAGLKVSGAYRTSDRSLVVVNTAGTRQHHDGTEAFLSVFAIADDGVSGSASAFAAGVEGIDPEKLARTAVEKCRAAAAPADLDPGHFDVVLEPRAIAEVLEWLTFTSFGAKQVQEGQSFMAGRLGEKVMGDAVTIYDDGYEAAGIPIPFDWEGVQKRRVAIIERGVAKGPVYDTLTAVQDRAESTGHAAPAQYRSGPMPSNLFVAAGDKSLDDLVGSLTRGLLVTRFHYVNGLLDTRKALFTGMTRDGTYLVENGRVTKAVKNLRFTESMLRAFSNVDGMTRERETEGGNWGGLGSVTTPSMLVRDFTFTGSTDF
ncbi:MAG: TldD/PmbA family protein [Candidatus Eisenbacteria bacterium]|nr:TldD/PmbA family protein [Candidatus Eisenbacteria bacterium]